MLDGAIVAGLAAVFLGVQAWAHHRSLLSEREAGEQRLRTQADAHAVQLGAQADRHAAEMERYADLCEKTMDRLQARSVLEYQAARQVAATPPLELPSAPPFDADWEEPSFARPMETAAPMGIGADE